MKTFAPNTEQQINWAFRLFKDWKRWRQDDSPSPTLGRVDLSNPKDLKKCDLAYALRRLLIEVKKADGSEYPGRTLYHIVIMIQLGLEKAGVHWKLLNDPEFLAVRNTLENIMKERCSRGIGRENPSLPATLKVLNRLWEMGLLGMETADALRNTLIVMVGFHCALRGGDELRCLRFPGNNSQFALSVDENGVEVLKFLADIKSKTSQGGLSTKGAPKKPKEVIAYGCRTPERSIVHLFKVYVSKCPPDGSAFWRRSRPNLNHDDPIWYTNQPVGRNTLGMTVKRLFVEAGLCLLFFFFCSKIYVYSTT